MPPRVQVYSVQHRLHEVDMPYMTNLPVHEHDWFMNDFHLQNGETLATLRLHYRTMGTPTGRPILLLHGTASSGAQLLEPDIANELFGPGQPLDPQYHWIIIPDILGAGVSSKPSDGLRSSFPHYTYHDMVSALHLFLTNGLGIHHVRAIIGFSMGGMLTWLWGIAYPGFMDALIPLACLPVALSGRHAIMRRTLIHAIRSDPQWLQGNYQTQPNAFRLAHLMFRLAMDGGTQAFHHLAPTPKATEDLLAHILEEPFSADANDVLYQHEAAFSYNPGPLLDTVQAPVLMINSADDERYPCELAIGPKIFSMLKNSRNRYYLIPSGDDTKGHSTVFRARHWKLHLVDFLQPIQSP